MLVVGDGALTGDPDLLGALARTNSVSSLELKVRSPYKDFEKTPLPEGLGRPTLTPTPPLTRPPATYTRRHPRPPHPTPLTHTSTVCIPGGQNQNQSSQGNGQNLTLWAGPGWRRPRPSGSVPRASWTRGHSLLGSVRVWS